MSLPRSLPYWLINKKCFEELEAEIDGYSNQNFKTILETKHLDLKRKSRANFPQAGSSIEIIHINGHKNQISQPNYLPTVSLDLMSKPDGSQDVEAAYIPIRDG